MSRIRKGLPSAASQHQVLGVAFLVLLWVFVWLTNAIFNKSFTDYAEVELQSSSIGLQLPSRADVKIRGVIVGEVLEATTTGEDASLTLGLYPDELDVIPANATARILPKTLFGEKFVALQIPADASSDAIAAGDVIEQTKVAIEVEKVLNDLYPLLRTVQPAQLGYTLNALSTALEGRGEAIGGNLVILNDYLKRTNPQIPALVEDLRLLSGVSDVYASVLPEVARTLRNSATTGNTFVEKEAKVQALFADVASFSSTSRDFLEQNGDNIIRLSRLGQQTLPVFAKYAPEYPCLLKGIVGLAPKQVESFRGNTLHINLEVLDKQPRGYNPRDDPRYGDRRGPTCMHLPNPPWDQSNLPPMSIVPNINDGIDEPTGKKGQSRTSPGFATESQVDLTSGYAGTLAERDLVSSIVGPLLGVPSTDVPDVSALLLGPLARGTEVSLR